MSQQLVCDDCGQVIDESQPYYVLTGNKVQLQRTEEMGSAPGNGVLTAIEPTRTLHYHEEHLPAYKIEGEPAE